MIGMPGKSYRGPLPPLTEAEQALARTLRADVEELAGQIGDRNVLTRPRQLEQAAEMLEAALREAGFSVERQPIQVQERTCFNLIASLPGSGRADEVVVVGGHYDSVVGCPAANDNGSGTAATLALARSFAGRQSAGQAGRTLRFLFFVNEEPPFFQTPLMGSLVYARRCQERRDDVRAMLSLETIGYYDDAAGSQQYPAAALGMLYPSSGDFVSFVGDRPSRRLVRDVVRSFRAHTQFPSQGASLPASIPGVGFSDHWSFWEAGYPGVMVTDTAMFRYPYYHTPEDTPDKVDFERLARVVAGLERVVGGLSQG